MFSRRHVLNSFLIFHRKYDSTVPEIVSLGEIVDETSNSVSGNTRKNIVNLSSAEFCSGNGKS